MKTIKEFEVPKEIQTEINEKEVKMKLNDKEINQTFASKLLKLEKKDDKIKIFRTIIRKINFRVNFRGNFSLRKKFSPPLKQILKSALACEGNVIRVS